MPELPEVETITKQLNEVLVGQRIIKVEVLSRRSFGGKEGDVEGKKILGVNRKAKIAIINLGGLYLLIHLKMTGQLIYRQGKKNVAGGHPTADWVNELPSKHTRIVFNLSKGKLFFNDQRLFGWVKVVDEEGLKREFKNYGPDVIDKSVSQEYLYNILQKTRRAIKVVVTDQAKIAGVGNIYANDGLWCAGISPSRPSNQVSKPEADKLLDCLRKVVNAGIKYGGATARDENYVSASGLGGKYQNHFLVYEQVGRECGRCKGKIKKITLGGRGTYYCPGCQR